MKSRNRAFRMLTRSHNYQHLIQYQHAQAVVRRIIGTAKRECWRRFCGNIGRTTPVGEVWWMIKRMSGVRRDLDLPVLKSGEIVAVRHGEGRDVSPGIFEGAHLK